MHRDTVLRSAMSLWERDLFPTTSDVLVVGGGITGLSTAIAIKELAPHKSVLVLEALGHGTLASTKNAGFACIGSVGELLEDMSKSDTDTVQAVLSYRQEGLRVLRQRLGDDVLRYREVGGVEVFWSADDETGRHMAMIPQVNHIVREATGLEQTFEVVEHRLAAATINPLGIRNKYEGCLHPGYMMQALELKALQLGVHYHRGVAVDSIERDRHVVIASNGEIAYQQLCVCTNSLAADLLEGLDVQPVSNIVGYFDTQSVPQWRSCYHLHKGYLYFRKVNNRYSLLGGGRHILDTDYKNGLPDDERVKSYLRDVLGQLTDGVVGDFEGYWSGLLGVGKDKMPIIQAVGDDIYCGAKLGGMGVAIGSYMGQRMAGLVLDR